MTSLYGQYFTTNNSYNPISNGYDLWQSVMKNPLELGWMLTQHIHLTDIEFPGPIVAGHEPTTIPVLINRLENMKAFADEWGDVQTDFSEWIHNEVIHSRNYSRRYRRGVQRVIDGGPPAGLDAAGIERWMDRLNERRQRYYNEERDEILDDVRNDLHINDYDNMDEYKEMEQSIQNSFTDDLGLVYENWDDLMNGMFTIQQYFNEAHAVDVRNVQRFNQLRVNRDFGLQALKNKKLG